MATFQCVVEACGRGLPWLVLCAGRVHPLSQWLKKCWTTTLTPKFTQHALRKIFGREDAPLELIIDNGTHFSAKPVNDWLKRLSCHHLHTTPRHPQSNGPRENCVRTLKSTIHPVSPCSFVDLDRVVKTSCGNILMLTTVARLESRAII